MNSSALSDDSDSDHSQQLLQQQQQTSSTMLLNTSMRVKSHDGGVSVFNSNNNKSNKVRAASTVASLQSRWSSWLSVLCSTKMLVLIVLSLQNSLFTVLRRYSQGVRKETYSTYEVLLVGEIIKMVFSAYMIREGMSCSVEEDNAISSKKVSNSALSERIRYLIGASGKMVGLALIYGAMNILSFVSLRNIGAGMFTIFAQCKILTTASFSALILHRKYSWTQWRALTALSFGVLLFSEPIWGKSENLLSKTEGAVVSVGVAAVLIEVTLSGFASIYFEKVIKTDPLQLSIWERNFQLALVRTFK